MAETLAHVTLVVGPTAEPMDIAQLEDSDAITIQTNYGSVKVMVRKMFNIGTDAVITFHDREGKQVGPLITQLFRKIP